MDITRPSIKLNPSGFYLLFRLYHILRVLRSTKLTPTLYVSVSQTRLLVKFTGGLDSDSQASVNTGLEHTTHET